MSLEGSELKLETEWKVGKSLGGGGFGRIYEAHGRESHAAVIKFVPKDPGADRELLFAEQNSRNVVPVIDKGEWNGFLVLVMPRADYSLREHLEKNGGKLLPHEAVNVLIDIGEALTSLEKDVVHRDIKPENILFFNGTWCLADFGIARYAEATTAPDTRKYSMTPPYAAPEQWRSERARPATDIYALGVVAYEIVSGKRPFLGPNAHDYREQHLHSEPPSLVGIPAPLQTLIMECLYKAPEARPTAANLVARLRKAEEPILQAYNALQAANFKAVQQEAEVARQESAKRSEQDRRQELHRIASASLTLIMEELRAQIEQHASAARFSRGARGIWAFALNDAQLIVQPPQLSARPSNEEYFKPAFDTVSHASIEVRIPRNRYDYGGRAHSLWYCDAQEDGVYRWYETAFMVSPLAGRSTTVAPFSRNPGEDAFKALSPGMAMIQVAWPFTPIDQGDEAAFIQRWIRWFGEAALGKLQIPHTMPEHRPEGSWRMR